MISLCPVRGKWTVELVTIKTYTYMVQYLAGFTFSRLCLLLCLGFIASEKYWIICKNANEFENVPRALKFFMWKLWTFTIKSQIRESNIALSILYNSLSNAIIYSIRLNSRHDLMRKYAA